MTDSTKITSKGQITLPKAMREVLGEDIVTFEIGPDNTVVIKPVHSVGGSLKAYQQPGLTVEEARNQAWEAFSREYKN